ncbi:MAG: 16S rRNA (adenine(1518)-N(6)/adenine(1519)-N(6))-dimethyltransferase RsmA [Coriobacteriia bacterium]|nr:16S rRNA (adenine(1518)-N(6)/adenine(1519)-N(6))-dimethyltransferase RsmA [Coriobacteriia bacterium]
MAHSPLASPSATRDALLRHGLVLKKSLGQHFLIDDNIVGRILALADLPSGSVVLEVGPGIGTLTAALCGVAGAVVAVERDAGLLPALGEVVTAFPALKIVQADAVRVPPAELVTPLGPPEYLVANLPYGVAATVILRFFEEIPSLRTAVVMVQAEVADRICASPGSKAYGAYTVKLRLQARVTGRFAVPRACFMPPPRVDSAVLRLDRVGDAGLAASAAGVASLASAAFAQRRKTLRNSVLSSTGWEGAAFDAAAAAAGIDGRRRAESLSLDEYIDLAREARGQGLLP